MNFSSLVGLRLLKERKRLGLSQAQAGLLCGVSREMWGKYERGKATMGTEVLSRFNDAGGDALFVLTGQRTSKGVDVDTFGTMVPNASTSTHLTNADAENAAADVALSPREEALLDNYRHSPESGKRAVETTASAFAQQPTLGCAVNGGSKK